MAYRVDGKIACQFSWGAVNYDVKKVIVLDAMHPTSGASDERYAANKIYYIPAGVTPASFNDLQQYRIWHRYWESQKTLLAQNQDVCIEFVPSHDIQLTTSTPIAIFTDSSTSDEDANFAIIHESGLVVAKTTGDTIDPNVSELYGLSGEKRSLSVTGVTLKAGFKYYIQYTNKTGHKNSTFQPAYFKDEVGNYLAWVHDSVQEKSVANINSLNEYLGVVTSASVWLAANEDDFMISMLSQGGLNNTYAYVRNGVANGAVIIGQDMETLPATEKDKYLKLDSGDSFMYIGNNYTESGSNVFESQKIYTKNNTLDSTTYKGIKTTAKGILDELDRNDYCLYTGSSTQILSTNTVYKKIESLVIDTDYTTQESGQSDIDVRNIIRLSYNSNGNKYIAVNGYMFWADRTGNVYQLKAGYSWDYNRQGNTDVGYDATTLVAADMVQNKIYYVSTSGYCPAQSNWLNAGLYCWTGSTFSSISDYNSFVSYCNVTTFADAVQEIKLSGTANLIGQLSDLVKTTFNGNYISNSIREQTVQTDKKFYLSINGQEV